MHSSAWLQSTQLNSLFWQEQAEGKKRRKKPYVWHLVFEVREH